MTTAAARRLLTALALLLTLSAAPAADADADARGAAGHPSGEASPSFDGQAALDRSQAALGRRVGDHTFLGRRGNPVRLADGLGRPLVVSLIYTSCQHTCPMIVQTLARAVEVAQEALGADSFGVVTVGFDARHDTPERMRAYATAQGIDLPNWEFLSADALTVDRLAADLGFTFFRSPQGFDHLAQTTILDAEGRVYRQVYGAGFEAPAVVEPLKELVFGRRSEWTSLSGVVNRVRLFCTLYDPRSGRYRFDYSLPIGVAIGLASLTAVGALLVREWRRTTAPRTERSA